MNESNTDLQELSAANSALKEFNSIDHFEINFLFDNKVDII